MLLEKQIRNNTTIPTSSMADIAFLLLSFFLVSTNLNLDKGLQLVLPATGGIKPVNENIIANLLINESGEIMLNAQVVELEDVRSIINDKLNERPQLIVSIQTGERTRYQDFISVLDQVQMTGCQRISIADPTQL